MARPPRWPWLSGFLRHLRAKARWIGLVLGIAIVAISIAVLVRLLRDIDVAEVMVALKDRDASDLLLAACFIVLGNLLADLAAPLVDARIRFR